MVLIYYEFIDHFLDVRLLAKQSDTVITKSVLILNQDLVLLEMQIGNVFWKINELRKSAK